ncbi:MAG: hypothetical protein IPO40_12655 [Fibrobacteres bacterium]|nr:hypothetical protein [Fibrobacterota bacterium]
MSSKNVKARELEKQAYEFGVAERFLRKKGIDCGAVCADPPNPDIFIPGLRVGLELVRYSVKNDFQKDEGSILKMLRRAEQKYRDNGGTLSAHVWLFPDAINGFHRFSRVQTERFENELANFGLENAEEGVFDGNTDQRFFGLVKEVELFADPFRQYWQFPRADSISFSIETLMEAIAGKESKVGGYTRDFTEKWLLVYSTSGCNVGNPNANDMFSSVFKITQETSKIRYSGKFDRVFLLDWYGEIVEIESRNLDG